MMLSRNQDHQYRISPVLLRQFKCRLWYIGRRLISYGPKRCRYSAEVMKALTISALTKLPLN
jgi:hypothetical protein